MDTFSLATSATLRARSKELRGRSAAICHGVVEIVRRANAAMARAAAITKRIRRRPGERLSGQVGDAYSVRSATRRGDERSVDSS